MKFEKKDIWYSYHKDFSIEIVRWSSENKWNIYCYIYPPHRFFNKLKRNKGISLSFPFHGGVSYFNKHKGANGSITSIQIGCDYQHLSDDEFRDYTTLHEALEILDDAETLIKFLS